jgi:RNA polymerase sigma factor (sigma-70 family)
MRTTEEQWIEAVYRESFPQAARMVQRLGGDSATARDLFHDAMIIYLEKKQRNSLPAHAHATAYIVGITRILWYRKYRQQRADLPIDHLEEALSVPADFYTPEKEPAPSLKDYLLKTGKKCMELLQAFYYEKLPMNELAQRFRFSSSRSATVQKHKCLEKLREQVKQAEQYAQQPA